MDKLNRACKFANVFAQHQHNGYDKWAVKSIITHKVIGAWGGGVKAITDEDREKEGNVEFFITPADVQASKYEYSLAEAEKVVAAYEPSRDRKIEIITENLKDASDSVLFDIWEIMEDRTCDYLEAEEIARRLALNKHKGSIAWYVSIRTTGNLWVNKDGKLSARQEFNYMSKGDQVTIHATDLSHRYDLDEARAIVRGMYENND